MRKSIIVSRRLALFLVCAFMSVAQAMADDVATIGNTGYATLEEALNAATSGSTVVLTSDYTLNSAVTVKSGVNLVIPYKEGGGLITTPDVVTTFQNPTNSSYGAYATLTLSSTASITVEDGGVLCVAGQQYSSSNKAQYDSHDGPGAVSGTYGCINMSNGGKIALKSGAILYAWGYIVGQNMNQGNNTSDCGIIEALSGSTVYEDFAIGDWRGGGATLNMANNSQKVFPFNQYFIPNIEIPLTIYYGAKEITKSNVNISGSKTDIPISLIGSSDNNTSTSLFNMESNNAYVKKWYDAITDEQCYETNGEVSLNSISITVYGQSISSSYVLPLTSTMNVRMKNGVVSIPYDIEILPGAKVTVGADAEVNVSANLYVFDSGDWGLYSYGYYFNTYQYRPTSHKSRGNWNKKTGLDDAKLIVNGKLKLTDNGTLYTTTGGADICGSIDGGEIDFSKEVESSTTKKVYQVSSQTGKSIFTRVSYQDIPVTAPQLKNNDADGSYTSTAGVAAGTTFHNEDGKWYKETVTLKQDVTSIPEDWTAADTEYKKYTLSRTFYKGWNSVVLPFATTRAKLGADEAIEFTGAPVNDGENTVTLQFKGVESLEANKPYMLYYASDPGEKTYSFVEKRTAQTDNKVTVTQDQFQFIGSYVYYDKENKFIQPGDYLVSEDGFSKTTVGGNRLYAYRAFFHPTETTSAKLNFTIDGDEVTGIRAIQLEDALRGENTVGNGRLYNLSGQRVNSSYKGIVVKNGKKMLLK